MEFVTIVRDVDGVEEKFGFSEVWKFFYCSHFKN